MRQRLGLQARAEFVAPLKNFPRIQIIFLEQIGNVRRHERKTGARQNRGRPAEKLFINQRGLRVVGHFRRARDVSNRRQQRVLNHGTKQRAGAEIFRALFHGFQRFVDRFRFVPGGETAIHWPKRDALPVDDAEDERALLGDFYLRVEAGLFEGFGSRHEFRGEGFVFFHRAQHCGQGQPVQVRRHGIEKNEAAPGKNARHQFPERRTERFFGRITFRDPLADFFGE